MQAGRVFVLDPFFLFVMSLKPSELLQQSLQP